ncbi:hypothetical protein [Nakamurella flavida]
MVLAVIVACEIGFWVAVAAGLIARYVLRRPRLGAGLLVLAPVCDVVLLVATAVHLGSGATATWQHSVAAYYLGFSVAYGHRMVAWADARFAHRFANGPAPVRATGSAYTRLCWADVGRTALAVAIAGGVLLGLTAWVDDPSRTAELTGSLPLLGVILGVELLWAISSTLWPRRSPVRAG